MIFEFDELKFLICSFSECLTMRMEEPDNSGEAGAALYYHILRANSKYDSHCIVFECHQRTFAAREALNNQVDKMTWPVDISQHLSLITTGTPVFAQ